MSSLFFLSRKNGVYDSSSEGTGEARVEMEGWRFFNWEIILEVSRNSIYKVQLFSHILAQLLLQD